MPYHGITNGASGSLLSLKLCQTPVSGIPQMGEKEREEKKGGRRLGENGVQIEQKYVQIRENRIWREI